MALTRSSRKQLEKKIKPIKQVDSQEVAWGLIAAGSAVVAGFAARRALESSWRQVRKADPPSNPASPETTWNEALLWTTVTSLVMGLAQLLGRRGATEAWRRSTGRLPPGS